MTDPELRQLERRWQASGSSADEAKLLRARVRQGALTPRRLELAARCGYPGAVEANPEVAGGDPLSHIDALARAGGEAALRAAVALTRVGVDAIPAEGVHVPDADLLLLGAIERHLLAPANWLATWITRQAHGQEGYVAHAEESGATVTAAAHLSVVELASASIDRELIADALTGIAGRLGRSLPEASLRAVLRQELAPWALGLGDPVAARVAGPRGVVTELWAIEGALRSEAFDRLGEQVDEVFELEGIDEAAWGEWEDAIVGVAGEGFPVSQRALELFRQLDASPGPEPAGWPALRAEVRERVAILAGHCETMTQLVERLAARISEGIALEAPELSLIERARPDLQSARDVLERLRELWGLEAPEV